MIGNKWLLPRFLCIRSSEAFVARASSLFKFLRSSQNWVMCLVARARSLALERASASFFDLKVVILRLSELSFARASEVYVLGFFARASFFLLEHASGCRPEASNCWRE